MTVVKICGLKTAEAVAAAVSHGADMVGFVFFPKSPRHIDPADAAALAASVPAGVVKVGLTVDMDDAGLAAVVASGAIDMLQLHGHETPARAAEVRSQFGLPVMKALPIAGPDDVAAARAYEAVADRLLFDAKPPKNADRPGGNAVADAI